MTITNTNCTDHEESTWTRLKSKVKNAAVKAGHWIEENKELVIVAAPLAIGGVTAIVKTVGKHVNLRKAESIKELYCYDRRLGHYWALRRELTNSEWLEIDRRVANGERLADVLNYLKVLK